MTKFEKKLKLLFDAQDFFRDPKLDEVNVRAIYSRSVKKLRKWMAYADD